jgi:serine protease Do
VSRGRIGVVIQEVTRELAESFGLSKPQGALVNSVEKGGPAEKAGLEPSDVILKFNGKPVNSSSDLPRIVAQTKPGAKATVQIWRKGGTRDMTVTVGEMPDERVAAARPSRPGGDGKGGNTIARLGLTVSELGAEQRKELGTNGGLLVENVDGPSAKAGLRRGDVILALNNHDVKSVEQLTQLLAQYERARSVAVLVRRGEGAIYIPIRLDAN